MLTSPKKANKLIDETSPYLIQHAYNPVDWYPWGKEAFDAAKQENKPVFLSIGYSTCHWCHVMAHESFEDEEIAGILNERFISIKVDKEERPDIDHIYMSVCQAFTGSGGWPTSIFLTPDQKPFFAGTYFPKSSKYGLIGFRDLLIKIHDKWVNDRENLTSPANEIVDFMKSNQENSYENPRDKDLVLGAVSDFKRIFDRTNGGFGNAPKFPSPHNLLLLLDFYEKHGDADALEAAEKTLRQMYKGGIFDHIGYGFSRYSTDKYWLVPHFEKMLYDNALLIMAYSRAYFITKNQLYREIAEKTADYILREMTHEQGGFYSAQDADSDGVEGKYYVFDYDEIPSVIGDLGGQEFNRYYNITRQGNFEGKSIPNLLITQDTSKNFDEYLTPLRNYRKERASLHLDDKILTSWNALMISAFTILYRITGNESHLNAAKRAQRFIEENLCEQNTLFVSFRDGKKNSKGFLDDYAFYIFALITLYQATLDNCYLDRAKQFCEKVVSDLKDHKNGGFYFYGKENEQLILTPKETYDGAVPSGNSVMAHNFVKLFHITDDEKFGDLLREHIEFMSGSAYSSPAGHSFYLLALSMSENPPASIVAVMEDDCKISDLINKTGLDDILTTLNNPTSQYSVINGKTTFYVCKNHSCLPPSNELKL
ncbi:MAG: thioredoxin domain-containing protein [Oscillospiraceae bacterium]|nr:thioredoxin domain-containing protein [Oscillospiraceae bacterium]